MDSETAEQVWIGITRMALEAKKAGFNMGRVFAALREAKAMLNECRINPRSRGELLSEIDVLLEEAKQGVFAVAEPMGEEFVNRWKAEFKKVLAGEKVGEFPISSSKFIAGMPRDKKWVKIASTKKLAAESIEEIARKHGIKAVHAETCVTLAGSEEQVAKALKEISALVKNNIRR